MKSGVIFGSALLSLLFGLLLLPNKKSATTEIEGNNDMTRGERNNNPGNLRYNGIPWVGLDTPPNDSAGFCRFVDPVYGIRAMFMDLRNDYLDDGLTSIRALINEYAPHTENNTISYINFVAGEVGVGPDQILVESDIIKMIKPMIQMENGRVLYSDSIINEGVSLA